MREGVEWKAFGALPRSLRVAARECSQLSCGSVTSVTSRRSSSPTTKWSVLRDCDGWSVADCLSYLHNSRDSLEITCSGKPLDF